MNGDDRLAFTIREAAPGDEGAIVALLRALAVYEKLEADFHLSEARAIRDLLGPSRVCTCHLLLAEREMAGVAVVFPVYRSFSARHGLFIEDLFVLPHFRGRGAGRALLAHLARVAHARNGFLEWRALDWNKPAHAFYEGLGAVPLPEWTCYRLEGAALERFGA